MPSSGSRLLAFPLLQATDRVTKVVLSKNGEVVGEITVDLEAGKLNVVRD